MTLWKFMVRDGIAKARAVWGCEGSQQYWCQQSVYPGLDLFFVEADSLLTAAQKLARILK